MHRGLNPSRLFCSWLRYESYGHALYGSHAGFAKDILHGGPDALGFLMGSAGVGALEVFCILRQKKVFSGLDG